MSQAYEPVMGLEVHVELNTKTKMFCRCSADYFGQQPNTHVCPVCLGLPGALPMINQQAIDGCIKIGLALNCSINPRSYFERKNYFYPDLAKGFQTSQLVLPVAVGGWLDVEGEDGKVTRIRINRAHQEEDTGKLTHVRGGELIGLLAFTHAESKTFIDFNRSSVPLVEIVTEPDFSDTTQVKDYAKKLQQVFRYLGVSNADMERGDMRLECNVSVRPVGQKELPPYRVELKNINSFRFMEQAVKYEIARQIEALEKGEKIAQETRGWDENKKETYVQRSKEEAHDYRYFPEPDLPELRLEEARVKSLASSLPLLPWIRAEKWVSEYSLNLASAKFLSESKEMADYFEDVIELGKQKNIAPKEIANQIINFKIDIKTYQTQQVIEEIQSKKTGVIDDEVKLEELAKEVINENGSLVESYKAGRVQVIQALVGLVMRKAAGKANATKVKDVLEHLLN